MLSIKGKVVVEKLISVIVPVYKVESYLKRCVDSILNQTYTNLEIILVDDGSPDNCGAICDEYAKKDIRVKVIHKQNEGVSKARNEGLSIATGEYVTFVDSDDYIEPNMYEQLYLAINRENADLAVCGFRQVRVNGEQKINDAPKGFDWSKENIIINYFTQGVVKEIMYSPWNKLFRTSKLENLRFNTKFRLGEDILFIFEFIEQMEKMIYVEGAFYHYVMHPNSAMTSSFSVKRFDYIEVVDILLDKCKRLYKEAHDNALFWAYLHKQNTCRSLCKNQKLKKEYFEIYNDCINFCKQNRKKVWHKLVLKRKIDYIVLRWFPFLFKVI